MATNVEILALHSFTRLQIGGNRSAVKGTCSRHCCTPSFLQYSHLLMAETIEDGMEIISIGEIYQGPWDKKYWSSSRAKDRYPHPVGYKAMRTHNGITYKMEILEGIKGPSFTINSTDGHSCSGQTPQIAWESFQKKGSSHLKGWSGRRSSGKMAGVEFFGLKNPHVQRLLRELVRNVNGSAETSLKSTTICNETSSIKHKEECAELPPAQLPPCLPKPFVAVKSRKHKICSQKSVSEPSKRPRPENQKQRTERDQSSGILVPDPEAGNLMIDKKHFVRSEDIEEQEKSSSNAVENEREASISKDEVANDMGVFAPDTLNLPLEATSEILVDGPNGKDEVPDSITDSPPEVEIITNTANGSTAKSEEDSMGEDITNSTMPVLYPKIIPLVNTYTRKKRAKTRAQQKSNKTDHAVNLARAPVTVDTSSSEQVADITSVAPDSFENDQHEGDQTSNGAHQDVATSHMVANDTKISSCFNVPLVSNGGRNLSTDLDSRLSKCEEISSFAPDSFENDQFQNHERDHLPPIQALFVAIAGKRDGELVGMETSVQTLHEDIALTRENNINNGAHQDAATSHIELHDTKISSCSDVNVPLVPNGGRILSNDLDSRLSKCEDVSSFAPDSFDDQFQNPERDHLPPMQAFVGDQIAEAIAGKRDGELTDMETSVQTSHEDIALTRDNNINNGACQDAATSHIEVNDTKISSCSMVSLGSNEGRILSKDLDTRLSKCEDISFFAPDSFEKDHFQNLERDQSPQVQDLSVGDHIAEAVTGKKDGELVGMETSVQTLHEDIALTREDNINNLQGQHSIPLSESIICRNFPDDSATKMTCEAFDAGAKLQPLSQILHTEKSCGTLKTEEIVFIPNSSDSDLKESCIKLDDERIGLQLVGCYIHPMPISMVLLSTKGNEIYICVLSGLFMENRTLFLYKAPIEGKTRGSPSFIGHAAICLPVSQDAFGREIALDSTGFQLTPDGQCLVLLNSIKVPICSEQKIHCTCSACTFECLESNAVKVVQVKLGHVSVVMKLKTSDRVRCILVCEPHYLLAADEGGRLYLWLMNSTWSAQTEECDLSASGFLNPYIVELKNIPNYKALVVGHNGFGEFMLWDICKRTLVTRFSAPTISVASVIPVNLFRWKDAGIVPPGRDEEEVINDLIDQTKKGEKHEFCSLDGDDIAIWLLISTIPDPLENGQGRSWKLALLVKNIVILGNTLDPSATAVGTSLNRGIIGTTDGQVYMWELSRGTKLGNLESFKDGVCCIAADETGAVAVAGDGSRLRLYVPTQSQL